MKNRRLFFSAIAIVISFFMFSLRDSEHMKFANLWILPLVTGLAFFIPVYETKKYIVDSITLLAESVILLRNCIAPLMLLISNFEVEIDGGKQGYYDLSILLLSLETIFVFLISFKWTKKIRRENLLKLQGNGSIAKTKLDLGSLYIPILILVGIMSVVCINLYPPVIKQYTPLWMVEEKDVFLTIEPTIFDTLFSLFFGVFRIMLVVFGIEIVSRVKNKNFLSNFWLLLLIFLPAFFTSENYGYVLISIVVTYIFINYTLGSVDKILNVSIISLSIVVFVTALIIKGYESEVGSSSVSELSSFLQAYIPGLSNLSGVFRMPDIPITTTLFYDLYYMIPFRNTIFGIPGDFRSVIFFNEANGVTSQIIPCVGQCYLYFGYFGSFVSALPVSIAYWLSCKMRTKLRPIDYILTYACVYCALTPFLYNYTILGSWLFMTLLPAYIFMYIPTWLNKK